MFIQELLDYLPFQKVFEICVRNEVNLYYIVKCNTFTDYNNQATKGFKLTEREFNSIKGLVIYVRTLY